ncbi:hypothetical protein HPB50_018466 [Hyalomma asiaticum]|uniref:Uncharacterized protein n=1 Tax=Hyalomma asiaticum TaxID=266040 RepID=A0ACB7TKL0_HYAAI|nr:hypothetical protein HPB50_018466 [Hyalomma asiaticum]
MRPTIKSSVVLTARQHVGRNAGGPAAPAFVGIIRVGLEQSGQAKPSSALGRPSTRANTRHANAAAAAQPPSRCPLLPGRCVTPSERRQRHSPRDPAPTSQTGAQTQGRQTNAISLAQCLPLPLRPPLSAYVGTAGGPRFPPPPPPPPPPPITGASRKELCFFGRRLLLAILAPREAMLARTSSTAVGFATALLPHEDTRRRS